MADIAKDTRLTPVEQASVAGLLQSGKFTGVTGKKVLAVARQNLLPYLGTDAGRQEVRVLQRQGLSEDQIEHRLLSSLAGIGSKQIGQTADVDYREMPGFNFYLKQKAKAEASAQEMQLSQGETGATVNPQAPTKIEVDEQGRPYTLKTIDSGSANFGTGSGQGAVQTQRVYDGVNSQVTAIRANYKRLHPGEAMPDDKKLVGIYNSAVEKSALTTLKTEDFTPKASNIASQTILGLNYKKGDISGLQGKQLMLLGTSGEKASELLTLPDLEKRLGITPDKDHKITSAQVTGRIKRNPLIPGAYRVTLTAGGKSYEVAVSGPKQEQDFMAPIQSLVNTSYNGGTASADIGNLHVRAISAPNKDGSGFETQVRKYEIKDGKYVAMAERDAKGNVKKDKNGKTIYSQSLDSFTNEYHQVFMRQTGDLFNVSGFTNKEADDDPDEE